MENNYNLPKLNYQWLFWAVLAFVVIVSAYFLVSINQKLNTATTTNTVSFSGEGKVLAKPDVAVINLSIVTEATTSKAAQDENSRKSRTVTDFLTKQDVDDKDIKTTGYNIYPQYQYPQNQKPQISGYQVNQAIQVKVRDLDKTDTILDGIVSAGVNQVNSFQLTIDDPEALRAEARKKAIEAANEKADTLKSQLNIRLGRIVNFSESSGGAYPVPMYESSYKGMGMGGGGGPSVPTGENEIVVDVTITYQIK